MIGCSTLLLRPAMMPGAAMLLSTGQSIGLIAIQHTVAVCVAFSYIVGISIGVKRAVNPGLFSCIDSCMFHRSVYMCLSASTASALGKQSVADKLNNASAITAILLSACMFFILLVKMAYKMEDQ
jgi:hypothetical protein